MPIDRLISLLREMTPEELLMAQVAIRALAPRNGNRTAEDQGAELATREEGNAD